MHPTSGEDEPGQAGIVTATQLTVALDYGSFYLHAAEIDPDVVTDLVGEALDEGIAQAGTSTVVISPHQNNFAMPLLVEVWDGPPSDDVDEWEEAFEAHVDVGPEGLVYESPTLDLIDLPVPSGS